MEKFKDEELIHHDTNIDIPASHLEGISQDTQGLEKKDLIKLAGENCFENYVAKSPGVIRSLLEIKSNASKEMFCKAYFEYITEPRVLQSNDPELYGFLKERVFFGYEYRQEDSDSITGFNSPAIHGDKIAFGCSALDYCAGGPALPTN